jgi:hypothetical protein
MNIEEALAIIEAQLDAREQRLTDIQELVLRQVWEGHTYLEIAESANYGQTYIKDVGSKLWQSLSIAFGVRVTKTNIRVILRQHAQLARLNSGGHQSTVESISAQRSMPRYDWEEAIDVSTFFGRSTERSTLQSWILDDRCRLITILGMGVNGEASRGDPRAF